MLLDDQLYGTVTVEEAVLVDLLACRAVQRLDKVLQHGITGLIGVTRPATRLEHSIGVMLLVRRLGASLEEQIAALLHDVSHTAFSHVIDYVVDNHDGQSYHEDVKESYIAGTDLPAVLAAHGYDWRDFLEESDYPLLEQPAPALCADRLDYFLRDSLDLLDVSLADCHHALAHLVVHEGRTMTDDLDVARWLAYNYIEADDRSWANFREVGLYELAAQAIRLGLDQGVITEADFMSTDQVVWDRLHASPIPELQQTLALVSPETRFVWDADRPDFMVSTKIRTIDPDVALNGTVQPLSTLDADYAQFRVDYLARKSGKWPFRVENGRQ